MEQTYSVVQKKSRTIKVNNLKGKIKSCIGQNLIIQNVT